METKSLPSPEPNDVESRYEANQRLVAIGAILGSVGLAVQHIFVVADIHGWPIPTIVFTALTGWLIFGIGTVRNWMLGNTSSGRAFMEYARSDERLLVLRLKAFTTGFFAMLGMQVILLIAWMILGHSDAGILTIPVIAPATIAAGVTGTVLRYQILSNR